MHGSNALTPIHSSGTSYLYFLCEGTCSLSLYCRNSPPIKFANESLTKWIRKMSSPTRSNDEQDFSVGEHLGREIQEQDSSLRDIYEARLQLALRLEENLALRRAISLRQRQSFAPPERSRLRANGRMR
jgi:hypothetical protein